MTANFFFFWALTTYAIRCGDIIGILLAAFGFVFMHTMLEDLYGTA